MPVRYVCHPGDGDPADALVRPFREVSGMPHSVASTGILVPLGRAIAFTLCLFAMARASAAPIAEEPSRGALSDERILDDTRVIDIAITLADDDWKTLRAQSRDMGKAFRGDTSSPFTWFRGDITIDGVAIGSVGLRKKGFLGSLDSATPSLLVDFNRYVDQQPVGGMTRLTLNNNKQDRSVISQSLAYRVFRAAGVPAPRVGFADVTVNGERLGIYSNVEPVRRPFLGRSFGDGKGTLWEGTICDIVPASLDRMDKKVEGPPADEARLAEVADLLAADGDLDLDTLSSLVDLDHFLRFWCVEGLLNVWDGYCANQNNYFVYASPADGRFRFIPWGADATAGAAPGFGGPFGGKRVAPVVTAQAALPNRLYFSPGMPDRYRATFEEVMRDAWNEEALLAEITRLQTLLEPRLGARQADAPKGIDAIRSFIRTRRAEIEAALADWPQAVPATWRRPIKTRLLGTAEGAFSATYRAGVVDDVPPAETAIDVVFDDAAVGLRDVETSVSTFAFPGFGGGPPGDPPISVVISATRTDDGKPLAINLFLDRRRVGSDESVPVSGMVTEGASGFGIPGLVPMRTVDGTFVPTERGTEPGALLSGRVSLRVTQIEGGLMNMAPSKKPVSSPATSGPAPPDGT